MLLDVRAKQFALALALLRHRERPPPTAEASPSRLIAHLQRRLDLLEGNRSPPSSLPSLHMGSAIVRWLEDSGGGAADPRRTVAHGLLLLTTALRQDEAHWTLQPAAASQLVRHVLRRTMQLGQSGKCEGPIVEFAQRLCKHAAIGTPGGGEPNPPQHEPCALLVAKQQVLEMVAQAEYGHHVLSAFAQTVRFAVHHATDDGGCPEQTLLSTQPVFGAFQHVLEQGVHRPQRATEEDQRALELWMTPLREAYDACWHLPSGMALLKLAVFHLSMLAKRSPSAEDRMGHACGRATLDGVGARAAVGLPFEQLLA